MLIANKKYLEKTMKKAICLGILAFMFMMMPSPSAWSATEVDTPDIPTDFSDTAKWPFTHTESCMPAGKEYRSTAYARITNDKKVESVLTTSIDKTIFRYEYSKIGTQPDFGFEFIKMEKRWMRFDLMTDNSYGDWFEKYSLEKGISRADYLNTCGKAMRFGFGKFWDELFKKVDIE